MAGSGWGALGEMLTGQVGTPGAYMDGLKEGYSTEKAMQDARRAQSLAIIDQIRADSRGRVTAAALQELGFTEQAAPLLADVLRSNSTMNMNQLGDFQRPGNDVAARVAMDVLGDAPTTEAIGGYNRATAFTEGKPYEPYELGAGGKTVFDPVAGIATPTVLGEAELAAEAALAAQRNASAAKSGRAPAARAERPLSATAQEAEVLQQARDRIAGGADPAAVAAHLRKKGYPAAAAKIHKGD